MGNRLLMVEGKDDGQVVKHLCRAHDVRIRFPGEESKDGVDVLLTEAGGVDRLLDQVPIRLKQSDVERLAVVLDADENAQTRWVQLRDRLRRAEVGDVPEDPSPEGTIVDFRNEFGDVLRFGVWIMPDNQLPGILESFLRFLVPENDKIMPHVDRFIAGIPAEDRLFSEETSSKAHIHSFLAVQEEPGKPLGLAITFRYLDAKREVVRPFLNWLETVLIN